MNLNEVFPQPFRKYLAEFDLPLEEKKATCDDCRMTKSEGGFSYKADVKCCTFFPFLSNFQVGAILSEGKAPLEIINKLRAFIKTDQAQPLGVAPDFNYQKKFLKRGVEAFGRDAELLCPYYDRQNSRCGVWNWRGGVCTSFYCESSYGLKGIEFWRELEKYFLMFEKTLSYDALLNLGFNAVEADACLKAVPSGSLTPFHFRKNLWHEMNDQREEVYLKTHAYVSHLTHDEVQKLLGPEALALQAHLYQRVIDLTCK